MPSRNWHYKNRHARFGLPLYQDFGGNWRCKYPSFNWPTYVNQNASSTGLRWRRINGNFDDWSIPRLRKREHLYAKWPVQKKFSSGERRRLDRHFKHLIPERLCAVFKRAKAYSSHHKLMPRLEKYRSHATSVRGKPINPGALASHQQLKTMRSTPASA